MKPMEESKDKINLIMDLQMDGVLNGGIKTIPPGWQQKENKAELLTQRFHRRCEKKERFFKLKKELFEKPSLPENEIFWRDIDKKILEKRKKAILNKIKDEKFYELKQELMKKHPWVGFAVMPFKDHFWFIVEREEDYLNYYYETSWLEWLCSKKQFKEIKCKRRKKIIDLLLKMSPYYESIAKNKLLVKWITGNI